MNKTKNVGHKKKRGRRWKTPLGLLLLLIVGLAIVALSINSIAHSQINQALERFLSEGGTLNDINIQLIKGYVEFAGLAINQPHGYGTDPLLSLNKLELDIDPTSLFGDEIVIEQLALKGLSLILVRDKQGQLNLTKLVPPSEEVPDEPIDDSEEEARLSIPAIYINSIRFENLSVRLIDQLSGEQWSASLGLDLAVDDLRLKDLLNQEIMVGKVNLALRKIKVDQPEGFGQAPLLAVDKIEFAMPGFESGASRLIVSKILINNLVASVERNKKGETNLQQLIEALLGKMKETSKSKAQPEAETDVSTSENALPVIFFEQIRMEGGSFNYRDDALTEEQLVFPLNNIQLEVTQLRLFDDNTKADPALASVSFELEQPGDLPIAYFGSVATIGPVGSGVPPVNSQIRLTGFKLDTLGSLIPPATRASLGATGFDAALALALDNDMIKLQTSVLSDQNIHYDAIRIQGPLDAPNVEMGPILAGVYGRVSDGLLNLGKSGLSAGVGIARGGVGAAGEVGSGALKIGKNIGKNLFTTWTGLLTLDQSQVKEGLIGSTKGSADLTFDSVKGAGNAAGGGLKGSVSELKGDAVLQAWDKGIPARYKTAMQQAKKALVKMQYPPVTN